MLGSDLVQILGCSTALEPVGRAAPSPNITVSNCRAAADALCAGAELLHTSGVDLEHGCAQHHRAELPGPLDFGFIAGAT